jgi:zinc/manganese transport system substrate-binding protein
MSRWTSTVALTFLVLLVGCTAAPGGSAEGNPIGVVATTTQVGSIVEEIGGEAVDLTVLLEPGVEAHDFEMTPAAGAAVEQADLILKSGAGLEAWLDEAVETIGGADRVRDLSEGVELRAPSEGEAAHGEEEEEEESAEGEHADELDPHYWLSGPNAIVMVENARDALVAAAPDAAAAIRERAEELIARLEAADVEIGSLMEEIPEDRRTIVTDHDALGYFLDAYGLTFGGSVFPSLDVTAEPSAREIEELVAAIRASGVRAIFSESAVDPRLAQAVADETGAVVVDEPLYTDSLGPPGSGAETIDGMLLHNARVIHDALVGD